MIFFHVAIKSTKWEGGISRILFLYECACSIRICWMMVNCFRWRRTYTTEKWMLAAGSCNTVRRNIRRKKLAATKNLQNSDFSWSEQNTDLSRQRSWNSATSQSQLCSWAAWSWLWVEMRCRDGPHCSLICVWNSKKWVLLLIRVLKEN